MNEQVGDYANSFIINNLAIIFDSLVTLGDSKSDYVYEQVKNQVKKKYKQNYKAYLKFQEAQNNYFPLSEYNETLTQIELCNEYSVMESITQNGRLSILTRIFPASKEYAHPHLKSANHYKNNLSTISFFRTVKTSIKKTLTGQSRRVLQVVIRFLFVVILYHVRK